MSISTNLVKALSDNKIVADDSMNGITFASFNALSFLGKGTFGRVIKVSLKSDEKQVYACKCLDK